MAGIELKSFDSPDEVRPFEAHGKAHVVRVGGRDVIKSTFEPGWRWSQDVQPIAQTDSCQVHHIGYVLSGRMRITMNDGADIEMGPGDVIEIEPGHDAETVGDEPCVFVDFGEVGEYAKRA